jgi:tetratricopeptide (TPR) repeat protein
MEKNSHFVWPTKEILKTRKRTIFFGAILFAIPILAACATDQNEPDAQAVEHFNQGLAHHKVYQLSQDLDQLDLAIQEYINAIDLDSEYADAFTNRGVAYGMKGDLNQAFADFDQAIELDPEDGLAYYNRGIVYDKKGDLDRAIADYEKALELGLDPALEREAELFLEEFSQQR